MQHAKCAEPIPEDEPYSCPQVTLGSACSGPTRISLLDTRNERVLNTIEILDSQDPPVDSFALPYEIRPGGYYRVDTVTARGAGKPVLLDYRDYNGDGRPEEFALYVAPACMGLQTTLIGYSHKQDRVLQYPIELTLFRPGNIWTEERRWSDYLFAEKPVKPGHWQFEVDYRGRGGWLEAYDIRYDENTEQFIGKCVITDDEH
jgi:hypothetical protein